MKILCFLLILANVSFFLWEFRAGALDKVEDNPQQLNTPGVDTILLANEVEKESALILPDSDNEGQPEMPKPENTAVPSAPGNDVNPLPTPAVKQTEPNKNQLP